MNGGFPGAVASEWTKLWSVRSTYWCLVAALVLMGSSVALNGISIAGQHAAGDIDALSRTATQMPAEAVVYLVQFALCALATMVIASEYAHGSMRSTLQWIPVRLRVPVAKSAVVASVLFVSGVVLALIGVWVADLTLGTSAMPHTAADVVETVLLIGLYLALLGVMTVGIGTAVRSVAGTLVILFMVLMVVPIVLQSTGPGVLRDISHYFPGIAGMDLMGRLDSPTGGVAGATAVLVAWAAAALAVGIARLRGRDA